MRAFPEKDERILANGIYTNKDSRLTHKNNNVLVVGSPGSQKTLSYVLPNILNTYSESMVIVDVKGNLIQKTAGILKGRGYEIHCLDLKDFQLGERYDPIEFLKTEKDAAKFSSIIFPERIFSNDPFWEDMARYYLRICIQFIKERYPKSQQKIERVLELMRVYPEQWQTVLDVEMDAMEHGKPIYFNRGKRVTNHLPGYHRPALKNIEPFKHLPNLDDPVSNTYSDIVVMDLLGKRQRKKYTVDEEDQIRRKEWIDAFGNPQRIQKKSKALEQYKCFLSVAPSERTMASILGMVTSRMNVFDVEEVKAFMSFNDIDLADLGRRKTALYLILDDLDSTFSVLVISILTQLIQSLVHEAEQQPGNRLRVPVHFYLDDFSTYRIPDMELLIASLRSRGIGMSLILQSESQLSAMYGINGAQTILNSCDTYIYLGGTDIDTARSISLRSNDDLKHILELPYGKEYIFQRNEKMKLTDVFPVGGLFPMDLLNKLEGKFRRAQDKEKDFQRFMEEVSFDEEEIQLEMVETEHGRSYLN